MRKVNKNDIVNLDNAANAFSVISDETADISGKEQLSIGIRFLDKHSNPPKIREEFLGFTPLDKLNAQSVATNIISFMTDCDLNLNKLYGQEYDGCATVAGQEGGVSKLIGETLGSPTKRTSNLSDLICYIKLLKMLELYLFIMIFCYLQFDTLTK